MVFSFFFWLQTVENLHHAHLNTKHNVTLIIYHKYTYIMFIFTYTYSFFQVQYYFYRYKRIKSYILYIIHISTKIYRHQYKIYIHCWFPCRFTPKNTAVIQCLSMQLRKRVSFLSLIGSILSPDHFPPDQMTRISWRETVFDCDQMIAYWSAFIGPKSRLVDTLDNNHHFQRCDLANFEFPVKNSKRLCHLMSYFPFYHFWITTFENVTRKNTLYVFKNYTPGIKQRIL